MCGRFTMTRRDRTELAVMLGALENLKAGNTTVCEVFFSNRLGDGADALAAAAMDRMGLRSVLFRCSNDLPFAPGFVEGLADIDRRSRALLDRWKGSDRTGIGVGPLVPWSATRDYWEHTRELIAGGVRAHLHTAETPEYNELVREKTVTSEADRVRRVSSTKKAEPVVEEAPVEEAAAETPLEEVEAEDGAIADAQTAEVAEEAADEAEAPAEDDAK